MGLDVRAVGIIDGHCHPFVKEKEAEDFPQYWTLAAGLSSTHVRTSVLYQMVLGQLRRVLGMASGATEEEVLTERNRQYDADPQAYLTLLFRDANLDTLMADTSYPCDALEGYSVDPVGFGEMMPVRRVRTIVGIEPIILSLFKEPTSFQVLQDRFNSELDRQIVEYEAVALKTTIAYETGLAVEPTTGKEASRGYERLLRDQDDRVAKKLVLDHFLLLALDRSIELGLPMQVHTGVGDAPGIDVRLADPLLLHPILCDSHYGRARFVLAHAAYPHVAQAGYLANYPNVWIDCSEWAVFASGGVRDRILELFEMAPITKIVYGSDGYRIPEVFWFAAIHFKACLSTVLDRLVDDGYVESSFAEQATVRILADNARELYSLDEATGWRVRTRG